MAVDTFIPEVWAAELKIALGQNFVTAQPGVINRDYEGEIAQKGDTVHIGTLAAPTIDDYVKNVTVISPQTLATTDETMVIDQAKYFAFEVDDIDARQTGQGGQLLTNAATLAARGIAQAIDTHLLTKMTVGAGAILTAQDAGTADAAFLLMRRMRMALNKANVPTDGRWIIISPEFEALVLGDARFIDASKYGSNVPIMNGEIGRAIGFKVLTSNNLPAGTAGTGTEVSNFVVAGHGMATTFADQISKVEPFRPQNSFSDAIKGLELYGSRVVRPEALVVCDVDVTVA